MGNGISQISKASYEDIQNCITDPNITLINAIHSNNQKCLIRNTLTSDQETKVINQMIYKRQFKTAIYIYVKTIMMKIL